MFLLESFPETALFEIFSFVDHEELLDIRFLNKYFFKLAGKNIHRHLKYSSYYNVDHFKYVQNDFILKNSSQVQHLNLYNNELLNQLKKDEDNEIRTSNRFNTLQSIEITINDSRLNDSIKSISSFLKNLFLNLKRIKLLVGGRIDTNELLKLLNPDKVTSISITSRFSVVSINNILNFNKFKKLQRLDIVAHHLHIEPVNLINSNEHIFPELSYLTIITHDWDSIIDYNVFGNLIRLNTFNFNIKRNNINSMQFIKDKKQLKNLTFNYNFYNDGNIKLNKIIEVLEPVLEVSANVCIQIIGMYSNTNDNSNMDLTLFTNVKEIIYKDCCSSIQFLFGLLKYFPNIKKVNFKSCQLSNYQNQPLLLPDKLNQILFCVDRKTPKLSTADALELLYSADILLVK